jgi:hypothetical protein
MNRGLVWHYKQGNLIVSRLHKLRGYAQSLLIEIECVIGVNKLPCGVKWRNRGQASN